MTRSSLVARRIALPVTAALVGGTFAAVGFSAPAHAADVTLSKSFKYTCDVTAGGLNLDKHVLDVAISTKVPSSVRAGQTIPARPVNITLTLPELLRSSTYTLLQGRAAEGKSTDAKLTLASRGRSTTVAIPSLAAPKTDIPAAANAKWTIPATGTVPAIKVPAVAHSVALGVPAGFTIAATIYKADDSTVPSTLVCKANGSLALGSIAVPNNAPRAASSVKVKTKKNKAKAFVIRAKDADGDRLTYKVGKVSKKAGKVTGKGPKFKFTPKKKFKGKTSFYVTVRDAYRGTKKVKVTVTVR